ncbi:hypothetical protein [Bradyrhizobium sp. 5.13L]
MPYVIARVCAIGELIARIESGGTNCIDVAIGGENKDRLYITERATASVPVADNNGLNA